MSDPTAEEAARKVVSGTLAVRRLTESERETIRKRAEAAIREAEERGAARERERIASWAADYAVECGRCICEEKMSKYERSIVKGKQFVALLIVERLGARSGGKG